LQLFAERPFWPFGKEEIDLAEQIVGRVPGCGVPLSEVL
jgi:hypothetical protein